MRKEAKERSDQPDEGTVGSINPDISSQEINKTLGTLHFVATHQHDFINAILSLNSIPEDRLDQICR